MIYGYARVSIGGQSVPAQACQHRAAGAKTDWAHLRRVLGQLAAADVLMVTRLDGLARSTRDLLNTLAAIADRKAG